MLEIVYTLQESDYQIYVGKSPQKMSLQAQREALKDLLREKTDSNESILYSERGKPYFESQKVHFSWSHTAQYIALMIGNHQEVGIDIEKQREKVLSVLPKFLKEEEIKLIEPKQQLLHASLFWCAKEAVYKCYGNCCLQLKRDIGITALKINTDTTEISVSLSNIVGQTKVFAKIFDDFIIAYTVQKP